MAFPVAVGGATSLISYLARMKKLNDEIECNNGLQSELQVREKAESRSTAQPGYASTRVDAFLDWAEGRMARQTIWELKKSDAFISILESDMDSFTYVRDGGIAAAAAAAALIAAYAALRFLRLKEMKKEMGDGKGAGRVQPANPNQDCSITHPTRP